MGVGAKDPIDQLLVRKYADLKVENHSMAESAVPPEKMYEVMNDYAASQRMMLNLSNKLKNVGKSLHIKSAYKNYAYQQAQY